MPVIQAENLNDELLNKINELEKRIERNENKKKINYNKIKYFVINNKYTIINLLLFILNLYFIYKNIFHNDIFNVRQIREESNKKIEIDYYLIPISQRYSVKFSNDGFCQYYAGNYQGNYFLSKKLPD